MSATDQAAEAGRKWKKPIQRPPEDDDEMELTMERPVREPLNTAKNAFDGGLAKNFGGINTDPSVFDRTAVFHTSKKTEE